MDLLDGARGSPLEVASLLGVVQGHNLLNRSLFSCLGQVYGFVRRPDQHGEAEVPQGAVQELALNVSLFAFWSADLARPWWPCLPATGASSSFGFGVCLAACEPGIARAVARHAGSHDHHVRLTLDHDDPPEKPRHGKELRLPLRQTSKWCQLLNIPVTIR